MSVFMSAFMSVFMSVCSKLIGFSFKLDSQRALGFLIPAHRPFQANQKCNSWHVLPAC